MKNFNRMIAGLFGGAALLFSSVSWSANFPIAAAGTEGLSVFTTGPGDIIATYLGHSATYSNDLYLETESGSTFLFNNLTSTVGDQVNLGSFAAGTELVFRLMVNTTGYEFFTGAAINNPDGEAHARVQENWEPNTTLVSFEDLYNGPFNFNDLSFSFTNTSSTPVPLPAAFWMFLTALVPVFGKLRRK